MAQSARPKGPSRRTVATLLPPRLQTQVSYALADESEVVVAGSWHELERVIKERPVRAAIIDPVTNGVMDSGSVVRLLTQYPSLPIIAYVTLGPESFSGIAHLSRIGLEHVILHRFDDSVDRFKKTIEAVGTDPLVRRVLHALRPELERLPLTLVSGLQDMFDEPQRFATALDLSSASGIPSVRMYRSFTSAALTSPKNLLIAARALRAYSYLRDPGYSMRDVALKLGYYQPRILASHTMKVFGLSPHRARRHLPEGEAIARILAFIRGPYDFTI